jgi:hypothetical protein
VGDEGEGVGVRPSKPAFYASRRGVLGDWWTVLHPPYTLWHLSYVVIGATLAPHTNVGRLIATLLAFFAAVGIAAHTLDELHGHPLGTAISDRVLLVASVVGLAAAVGLGIVGVARVGPVLWPFIVVGPILVAGYNLELFGGRLHTDLGFALAWGAFPLLTAYAAQAGDLGLSAVIAAVGATALSYAQRKLSTPARMLRRQVTAVDGSLQFRDGSRQTLDAATLLLPLERTLRVLAVGVCAFAAGLAVARLA